MFLCPFPLTKIEKIQVRKMNTSWSQQWKTNQRKKKSKNKIKIKKEEDEDEHNHAYQNQAQPNIHSVI